MYKQQLILHLSLIPSVGPDKIGKLVKVLKNEKNPANWYAYSQQDFMRLGMTERNAQAIRVGLANSAVLKEELELIKKHNVSWTTLIDSDYPSLLKEIHAPPPVLYWQGESVWQDTEKTVAFVGARKGTNYGQRAINAVIPTLVAAGYTIVSGGAYGVDTMAHRAAIESGGKTIVVIGAGLLIPYLAGNQKLFKQVVAAGSTVVSAFPLMHGADKWTFPVRNRIIAGLSQGCVVVQAAKKSGALITSSYALQEGRQVFAVPGPFDDELSAGCLNLIKEGAKVVQNAQDILEEFGHQEEVIEQIEIPMVEVTQPTSDNPILAHCAQPISLCELSQKTGLKEDNLKIELFNLQLEGKIQQDFAGLWQLI